MTNATAKSLLLPGAEARSTLEQVLRDGAQRMLVAALEAEVAEHINRFAECRDGDGHRLVVRNGHHRTRKIDTGVGAIGVAVPRVDDRRVDVDGNREHFTSKILPPYLRKTRNIEALIPWLYLKGISTSDFDECLKMLVGDGASSVSSTTVVRLKEIWSKEFTAWASRSLTGKRYVYFWADGVYFNIRLEGERQCILVIVAATEDGTKELLAVHDGVRESEQSWTEVLQDLKARGLEYAPKLAVGDGALGFWKALDKTFPPRGTPKTGQLGTPENRPVVKGVADVDDALAVRLQRWDGQRLEARETRTSVRAGPAGLVASPDPS